MFVPGAWWHAVINLDTTIAITENFCNKGNFERVWLSARKGRKRLAYKWLGKLYRQNYDLYLKAKMLNQRDKWVMWEDKSRLRRANKRPDNASSSDSSQSSSTSSDSSDVSSDDERTIHEIKSFLPNEAEHKASQNPNLKRYAIEIHEINSQIKAAKKLVKAMKAKADEKASRSRSRSSESSSSGG